MSLGWLQMESRQSLWSVAPLVFCENLRSLKRGCWVADAISAHLIFKIFSTIPSLSGIWFGTMWLVQANELRVEAKYFISRPRQLKVKFFLSLSLFPCHKLRWWQHKMEEVWFLEWLQKGQPMTTHIRPYVDKIQSFVVLTCPFFMVS